MVFPDLPGEIRNKVYSLALISEHTVCVHLHRSLEDARRHSTCAWPARYDEHNALVNFSLMSRELRREARSFFFANNSFLLFVPDNAVLGQTTPPEPQVGKPRPSTLSQYARFLSSIGDDGRANITSLSCWDRSDAEYRYRANPGMPMSFIICSRSASTSES
jgi:hypothetical protein